MPTLKLTSWWAQTALLGPCCVFGWFPITFYYRIRASGSVSNYEHQRPSCSLDQLSPTVTPWTTAQRASLSFTMSPSLLRLMSIESVMPSNHLLLCRPLLLLPSVFPSIRVFSNELALHVNNNKKGSLGITLTHVTQRTIPHSEHCILNFCSTLIISFLGLNWMLRTGILTRAQ